jgi:phenylacetate-CoA ligase
MLAMQFQLQQSQWLPQEVLHQQQLQQLALVLRHAGETVPFYRQCFKIAGFDPRNGFLPAAFFRLPLLTRAEIQAAGDALVTNKHPPDHGKFLDFGSSGSTGEPIRVLGSEVTHFFNGALTLRDHLWHRRDLSGKLAAIRTKVESAMLQGWGPATDAVYATGPSVTLNIASDIGVQLAWLVEQNPDYLLSHPSNLLALARRSLETGTRIGKLREVRTFGETLPPDLREACQQAWGVPVTDAYSAEEVGNIALQCPEHEHYHVQAENLLVEILDAEGYPCAPGQVGRVVITTLHNFAMPLIRYANGDYAEVGEPCPCGRGLPVLKLIMGRQRNMLVLPDGTQHWPSFPAEIWADIAPLRQIQLVQHSLQRIEAHFTCDQALTPEQQQDFIHALQQSLGYPFEIELHHVQQIERGANCKYEDFISEIPAYSSGTNKLKNGS